MEKKTISRTSNTVIVSFPNPALPAAVLSKFDDMKMPWLAPSRLHHNFRLYSNLLLCFVVLCVVPESLCYPQRGSSGTPEVNCSQICDSSDHANFFPQQCSTLCRGYDDGLTPSKQTDKTRLDELEAQVRSLQVRSDSLLVVTVLLFIVVLIVIPILVYRNKFINTFFPVCCSSNYNKQQPQTKKKNNNGSRRNRRATSGAPTNKPTNRIDDTQELRPDNKAPIPPGTIITNDAAVRMASLTENKTSTMSPNPGTDDSNDTLGKRLRHPSESSCTAEVGANSSADCDPNSSYDQSSSHAYYNYGCSTSTLAVSPTQSRTSHTSGMGMPLSAGALLSQSHSSQNLPSPPAEPRSTPRFAKGEGSERRSMKISKIKLSPVERAAAARRPNSPESPSDATVVSNVTMATNLSCSTLTSDI
ncbi:hypothetical protein FHG87_002625 [Trinorchestia longiramus]|nr:hypothetical protein FHG87_002625 [Trinorchestia longiramus]